MKEASWNDCCETGSTRVITPDVAHATSLHDTALARLSFLDQELTEENANFVFEGLYSSLLELLHAHLIQEGYKVHNHICVGYYLRDELKNKKLFRAFDDCRYKRNGLVYYGKHMPFEVAQESIRNIHELITEVQDLVP